ncbi:MAG: hypothetical protein KDD25_10250 [Bdellovibrionales bacterium]|nr:hypothetical protein [Bdellovibrionales bacterium]
MISISQKALRLLLSVFLISIQTPAFASDITGEPGSDDSKREWSFAGDVSISYVTSEKQGEEAESQAQPAKLTLYVNGEINKKGTIRFKMEMSAIPFLVAGPVRDSIVEGGLQLVEATVRSQTAALGLPDSILQIYIQQAQDANRGAIEALADKTTSFDNQLASSVVEFAVEFDLNPNTTFVLGKVKPVIHDSDSFMRPFNSSSGARLVYRTNGRTEIWGQATETQLFRAESPGGLIEAVVAEYLRGRTDDNILGNYTELDSYELGIRKNFQLFGNSTTASAAAGTRANEDEYILTSIENEWGVRIERGHDHFKGSSLFDEGDVDHLSVRVRRPVFRQLTNGRLTGSGSYYRRDSDISQYSSFKKKSLGFNVSDICPRFRRFSCSVAGEVYRAKVNPNDGLPQYRDKGGSLTLSIHLGRD